MCWSARAELPLGQDVEARTTGIPELIVGLTGADKALESDDFGMPLTVREAARRRDRHSDSICALRQRLGEVESHRPHREALDGDLSPKGKIMAAPQFSEGAERLCDVQGGLFRRAPKAV